MTDEKVKRINELYHKAKAEGLTETEKKEQALLREEYIASFRKNLRSQLNQIDIQNADGSVENLGEKYGKKVIIGNVSEMKCRCAVIQRRICQLTLTGITRQILHAFMSK